MLHCHVCPPYVSIAGARHLLHTKNRSPPTLKSQTAGWPVTGEIWPTQVSNLLYHIQLTSRRLSSISMESGNSSLMATMALNALEDSLQTGFRPRVGCSPGGQDAYSDHVTKPDGGGGRLSLWANTSSGNSQGSFH